MDKSNREYTIHSPFSAQRWPLICTYVKKCAQLDARSGDPFKSNRESPFFMALDSVGACFVFFFFWMLGLRLLLLFLSRFKLGGHLMIFIVCISSQK